MSFKRSGNLCKQLINPFDSGPRPPRPDHCPSVIGVLSPYLENFYRLPP